MFKAGCWLVVGVQEDAGGRLELTFRDLGEQQLKNIAPGARAYAIDMAGVARPRLAPAPVPRLSIVAPSGSQSPVGSEARTLAAIIRSGLQRIL
jgi:hypothetical protein